ncbi:hypothetical protein A3709_10095 [Halioglobus sp. HI00S01]|uniref:DUF11 domain-containing protein n=1 Tax=Halioglobus sp. HI00S01 TaxID=1822214 RepID=UPI0007C2EDD0|nr:DUF11 domain-containing protein [Halioglobus sp. HI00S01]KZX53469.1 hypothetical protein A3709_10095 [Halioglobus sp. HI00S01]
MASAAPALSITKDASSNIVTTGSQLIYLLEIANTGTSAAIDVVVQDTLGPEVDFVAATGDGTSVTDAFNNTLVEWSFPFGPGQTLSLSIITTVVAPLLANWDNSANVQGQGIGPINS